MSEATQSNVGTTPVPTPAVGAASILPPASMNRPRPAASAAVAAPDRINGRLTHAGACNVIAGGGSVTFGGRVYNAAEDLPSDDQLDAYYREQARATATADHAGIGGAIGEAVLAAIAGTPAAGKKK